MAPHASPAGSDEQPATPAAPAAEPGRRSWLKRLGALLGGTALATPALARPESVLGTDVFVGEIMMFAGNFAPRGYALCNGQLLPISSNTALFSLLGTNFGGNGTSNFALPNLQGTTPIGVGNGPGLSPRTVGEEAGAETVTLAVGQIPIHRHNSQASAATGTLSDPTNAVPAVAVASNASGEAVSVLNQAGAFNSAAAPDALANAGGGQPVGLQSPYLVLNYCIALQGIFPPR
ncbi:phage tail protein [Hymenobacter rubidus]|uniref:phage tail protein n=1 Tax=Hymenobacter rubidus TaxID=1441626 RepID=UPI001F178FA2|nr:tail fiber protein [Hymenobacter rubidus]